MPEGRGVGGEGRGLDERGVRSQKLSVEQVGGEMAGVSAGGRKHGETANALGGNKGVGWGKGLGAWDS